MLMPAYLLICTVSWVWAQDLLPQQSHEHLNSDAVQILEKSLLSMFGLNSRPRPRQNIHIPQYMLELYNTQLQETDSTNVKRRSTSTANTVRSFHSMPHDSSHVIFNISTIPDHEKITSVELRVHRKQLPVTNGHRKYRLNVYDVIRPESHVKESITRLVDTRIVDVSKSDWISVDVLPAVERWRTFPYRTHALHMELTTLNGTYDNNITKSHLRLKRSTDDDQMWTTHQPLLVTYTDDGRAPRTRRNTKRKGRSHRRKNHKDQCRRHPLYVDFSDVGWNDWIVAPPGYHAYYCHGDCPFPLADHLNSTNHAIVQTLVNSVNPSAVPKACCVPTELSPISMLYLDEYEKVVLKNYQDMVVQGCGCR